MAGGSVQTILSEWLVVALIVFSLILEFGLHRLEHWINHKHSHLITVVRTLYRELMVLGLISFCFVIYETISKPTGDTIVSFEFAHLFIFLLAILYTVVVLISMFSSLRLSSRWKEMEQVDLVNYLHLKDQYARFRLRIHRHHGRFWRSIQWWFPNVMTLHKYRQLHELMAYHDIRFQFIFYRNLPEDFRFSSFLRKVKAMTYIQLVESHWTLYALFLFGVLCDIVRRYIFDVDESRSDVDVAESVFFIVSSVLLVIFTQVLATKVRKIFWELTKHPRMYYEGVDAAHVAEEIAAAEERLEKERAERRRSRTASQDDPGVVADDEATDADRDDSGTGGTRTTPPGLSTRLVMAVSPDPSLASPILQSTSVEAITGRSGSASATRASPRASGDGNPSSSAYGSRESSSTTNRGTENRAPTAQRHSLDRQRQVSGEGSGPLRVSAITEPPRVSYDEKPSEGNSFAEITVHKELNETAARHSLEFTRRGVNARPARGNESSRESSVAQVAVAAARKRSMEGHFERNSLDSDRVGSDMKRTIGSPRIKSRISSLGVSTDDERSSLDGRGKRRGSIDLVAAMPHEEIVRRHQDSFEMVRRNNGSSFDNEEIDLEAGIGSSGTGRMRDVAQASLDGPQAEKAIRFADSGEHGDGAEGGSAQPQHSSSVRRHRSLGFLNPTILTNLEYHEKAKNMEPAPYPNWMIKIFPRLGRVASPVEKLFWFGSHHFFFWCVEFVLFFSTVILAAATASLAILLLKRRDAKDKAEETGKPPEEITISALNIVSFAIAPLSLLHILFRIANIVKKYIFILHNASLVPEALAIEAIHDVSKKSRENGNNSGSDSEVEDEESARERRRKLGDFFRGEAEVGNMPGIEAASERSSSNASGTAPGRRALKRKRAIRLRRRRVGKGESDIPEVPEGMKKISESMDRTAFENALKQP